MSLRSRLALSRRVKIASGATFAGLALLGSGLVPASAASAEPIEAPEAAVAKRAVKPATKQAAMACRVPRCYGAIQMAYGDGTAAWAYNWPSKRRAMRAAHNKCDRATRYPCRRILWVRNYCGAVAVRWNGHGGIARWRAGFAYNKRPAFREALRKCRRDGGRCSRYVFVCTSRRR